MERTPQGQGQASGARATPDFTAFAAPPPSFAPVVMSRDQFKSLIDRIPAGQAAPAAGQAEGGQDYGPNVSSVLVKLPTFWSNDPELWFLQVESIFATRTPPVTRDITKFDHVVTALPTEALNAVFNVVTIRGSINTKAERELSVISDQSNMSTLSPIYISCHLFTFSVLI